MNIAVIILGLLTVGSAVAAMSLRNMVHCLLWLVVTFVGLAGLYLTLSATFLAVTQVLVYLGAVAILMVFAIMLTRGGMGVDGKVLLAGSWVAGVGIALLVFGGLASVMGSAAGGGEADFAEPAVRQVGEALLTTHVVPLQAIALLLTGALIGGVVLAMAESQIRGGAGKSSSREGGV
ncbi:MAG: NADH-quinone oxidoreductase subunit J [Limisphaerales bacterium]|jgi:NADH-quinone oxidoreductase subunit J